MDKTVMHKVLGLLLILVGHSQSPTYQPLIVLHEKFFVIRVNQPRLQHELAFPIYITLGVVQSQEEKCGDAHQSYAGRDRRGPWRRGKLIKKCRCAPSDRLVILAVYLVIG